MAKLTSKQAYYRKALLSKIHQAPMYKQMDEETYRGMLETNFNGKRSASGLSITQLEILLDYLHGKRKSLAEYATPAQISHIEAIWQQKANNPEKSALRKFIKNNFGKTVIGLQALTKKEANGIINAINRM